MIGHRTSSASRHRCARLAGIVFLLYIATGMTSMALSRRATGAGEGTAARLSGIAQHAPTMRVTILLRLVSVGYALVLATTLHSLTCDHGRDLALAAFCCRACEGAFIAVSIVASLSLLSISEAPRGADVPDEALRLTLAELLFKAENWTVMISSICFAAGSTLYSYLFLRARSIPVSLAWLGVIASVLLAVVLPFRLAGYIQGPSVNLVWLPMLIFEVTLALWLIIRGVTARPMPDQMGMPNTFVPRR